MSGKDTYGIKITSFFTPENIKVFKSGEDTDEVILKLLENQALNYGIGNVKNTYDNYIKDKPCSTCSIEILKDVYIYHFRLSDVNNIHLSLGVICNEDKSRKIVILITFPNNRPELYLKLEKALKHIFWKKNIIETLIRCNTSEDIWDALDQIKENLIEYIYAEDIMTSVEYVLKDNDTLKNAIDIFVKSGCLHIPVIDIEGDIVGEVNANELMKICLPRHILWMSDIKPVIEFQPYYNMLQHEDSTWLAEIMTHDVATVQIDDFAMKAAIVITKKEVDRAYVLENNKLVGMITLKHFFNKVLR